MVDNLGSFRYGRNSILYLIVIITSGIEYESNAIDAITAILHVVVFPSWALMNNSTFFGLDFFEILMNLFCEEITNYS